MSLLSNMRGPRSKTPLLLLLLLSSLIGKVFSQDDGDGESTNGPNDQEVDPETEAADNENTDGGTTEPPPLTSTSSPSDPAYVDDPVESGSGDPVDVGHVNSTGPPEEEMDLLTILIPAILAVVLIAAIICGTIIIKRQCNKNSTNEEQNEEDPYLDGSSTEKVPMPMFEEDVPSVLELEMDELDKWMQKGF